MLTYEQLDEIKTRASKATRGPWAWNSRHGLGAPNRLVMWPSHEYGCDLDIEGEEADLDFIAHARTDIPDLIAALEAAERERDACAGLASQAVSDMATAQNRITALEVERDALKAENQKMVTLLGHIHPDPDYEAVQEYHAFFEARRALEASK